MKQSKRIAETTFEESKKLEGILNLYNPEYIKKNAAEYSRGINLESILLNQTFFSDIHNVYKLDFDSFLRYQNILQDAFRFYQEDVYTETSSLITKQLDILEDSLIKRKAENIGYTRTKEFTLQKIATIPGLEYTLNGWMRLPIEEIKSHPFESSDNLHGERYNYAGFSLVRNEYNSIDFNFSLEFIGAPRVINTLLIPICLPLPKYIKSIEFFDSKGASLLFFDNLEDFASDYQVELLFAPIAVQKIVIVFQDVPGTRKDNYSGVAVFNEFYQSIFKKDVINESQMLFSKTNTSGGYWYFTGIFCFPYLRKYKTFSETEVRIPSKKEIKALSCIYDKITFDLSGNRSKEAAVSSARILVGVENESLLQYYPLPNTLPFDKWEEQFIKNSGQSISIGVPLSEHKAYFRASENYEVPLSIQDNYIKLKRKINDKIIWRYYFDTLTEAEARIDFVGNLVFSKSKQSSQLRIKFILESFDHACYFTPLIKNIVIGQL